MPWLNLSFLGGFHARRGGRPVTVASRKGQALLACLGVRLGLPESREKLATLLWGDVGEAQARHNLRQTLFALRRALDGSRPPALIAADDTLTLNPAAAEVDVARFERLVSVGTPPARAEAAALYQGDFLEGFEVDEAPLEEWLRTQRERLRAMALETLTRVLAHQSAGESLDPAVGTAVRLLALDPLQESVHRALMRLYARQDRRGLALRQYQICLELLQRELGVEPEAETQRLYRDLLPGAVPGRAAPPARPITRGRPRHSARARPELPRIEGPLIGRQAEVDRLDRLLNDARRGRGGTAVIVGDAGIGKTHLVHELALRVAKRRGQVLIGRSYESERTLAFGPWVDALRGWLAVRPRALRGLARVWRDELGRLLPELVEPGHAPPAGLDDHLRLFEAIARLLEHLAVRRSLLLVVEDLHWADDMSVRLLPFLSRRLERWPVAVIATLRADEVAASPALARVLEELRRHERVTTVSLSPLSLEETRALVRDRAEATARGPGLAGLEAHVWTLSEGNPFMIVETMRAIRDGRAPGTAGTLALPERIRELITDRLERLTPLAHELAGVAALIGREFDFAVLQRAAGLAAITATDGIEELVRRRILHAVGDRFDFTHDRIREVATDRLSGPRRQSLHACIADALEEVHARNLAPHYAALGAHYRRGEVWDKAVLYLRQAGTQAMERSAYREAAALFKYALTALEHLPSSRQMLEVAVDLRLDLRRCLNPLGDSPEILDYLREAEGLAERLGDDHRLARVSMYLMHELNLRGEWAETHRCGERALGIAERLGDASLKAAVLYSLGERYQLAGDYRLGADFFQRSIEATRHDPFPRRFDLTGLPSIISRVYLTLCLTHLGELEAARRWAQEALAMAETAAHPYSLAFAHWAMGLVLSAKGEIDDAITALERGHELCRARDLEMPYGIAPALGFALALKGRREEGLRLVEIGVGKAIASPVRKASAAGYLARLADTYALCGRAADARPLAERALDLARTHGELGAEANCLLTLAKATAADETSQMATSEALHLKAASQYAMLGMRTGVANCHLSLGRLYARWGRRDEAEAEFVAASTLYRSIGANAQAVSAEQALAAVARE